MKTNYSILCLFPAFWVILVKIIHMILDSSVYHASNISFRVLSALWLLSALSLELPL